MIFDSLKVGFRQSEENLLNNLTRRIEVLGSMPGILRELSGVVFHQAGERRSIQRLMTIGIHGIIRTISMNTTFGIGIY